uniref:Uncharacterized protein AlNc14C107G6256 n=1 Tax=Albugo laibachii Nc14 TaxID=890382 RepID=F0WI49_9STRA|nr:conserved hypothetical protein [Albugo laibachii Nc14]|eukprot:CCA20927.1 conserved hypothetical protein [Albugo laibachii Nc14]
MASGIPALLEQVSWQNFHIGAADFAELTMNVDAESQTSYCSSIIWQFSLQEGEMDFLITRNGRIVNGPTRCTLHPMDQCNVSNEDKTSSWWKRSKSFSSTAEQSFGSLQTFHGGCIDHVTPGDIVVLRWDTSSSNVESQIRARASVIDLSKNKKLEQSDKYEVLQDTTTPEKPLPHLIEKNLLQRPSSDQPEALESHHKALIRNLEHTITDMIAIFMTQPDVPLHEGSVRAFILALEAILIDGIQLHLIRDSWPEAPYLAFLMETKRVLRDDRGLVAKVANTKSAKKGSFLGWTIARYFLFEAMNKNILHHAIENLIKRRSIIDSCYSQDASLYEYGQAKNVVSLLSALNGLKFSVDPQVASWDDSQVPFNICQRNPVDLTNDDDPVHFLKSLCNDAVNNVGYCFTSASNPNNTEFCSLQDCSISKYLLHTFEWEVADIRYPKSFKSFKLADSFSHDSRGSLKSIQICENVPNESFVVVAQFQLQAFDIFLSFSAQNVWKSPEDENAERAEREELTVPVQMFSSTFGTDVVFCSQNLKLKEKALFMQLDNSFSMLRSKRVQVRYAIVCRDQYDAAWTSCIEMAQSICWKQQSVLGEKRCTIVHDNQRREEEELVRNQIQEKASKEDRRILGMNASFFTKPVSYLRLGLLDSGKDTDECAQCMTVFSYFGRQFPCPSCHQIVCVECSRHRVSLRKAQEFDRVCDRCFLKHMDRMKFQRGQAKDTSNAESNAESAAFAALRVDPTMEKYFKMLSVGVPHSAVVQKMVQDEVEAAKVAQFAGGQLDLSHCPPSRRRQNSHPGSLGIARPPVQLRKIHWTSLETNRTKNTIWERVTEKKRLAPIAITPHDFEQLVSSFGQKSDHKDDSRPRSARKLLISALDSRRSRAISIGLKQVKSGGEYTQTIQAIKECDFELLPLEKLLRLKEITPNAVEIKRYSNFKGAVARLEEAERFLVYMCAIPRILEKVESMLFVAQFPTQVQEIRARVSVLTKACYQILNSERLARFFELILVTGNALNQGSDLQDAQGVTLASLIKLSETKSIDQKTTLQEFLVNLIHDRGEDDILKFIDDLDAISTAKRYSQLQCISHQQELLRGITKLKKEFQAELMFDKAQHAMIQKQRTVQGASLRRSSTYTDKSNSIAKLNNLKAVDSNNDTRINPQAALLAAIRQHKEPDAAQDDATPPERMASPKPIQHNLQSALLQSIRDAKKTESFDSTPQAAQLSLNKPPRAAFLASIKNAKRPKVKENTSSALYHSAEQPMEPYDAERNPFLKNIGKKLSEIQALYEYIDLKVESMITAWEATARYFGEASTTSSDHVFFLLDRLILDMKTTQLKRHRQRSQHPTFPANLEVGHQIVTKFGAGVVLTIRRSDRKIEVRFPWSQESFLQPTALLRTGDRVWCKTFGIGFIRETLFSRGFCCVRFPFGFGFVRTSDIIFHWNKALHRREWEALTLHERTHHSSFFPGDLVRTPFGVGEVCSISQRRSKRAHTKSPNTYDYVVVFRLMGHFERGWLASLKSPRGYCLSRQLKLQYTLEC